MANDAEILKALGISDKESQDLIEKFENFLTNLSVPEYAAFQEVVYMKEALKALAPNVTARELHDFVAARCKHPNTVVVALSLGRFKHLEE